MTPSPLFRVAPLSERWFDRPQYRPRVGPEDSGRWFLLSGAVPRAAVLPPPPAPVPEELRPPPEAVRKAVEATYEDWDVPDSPAARRNIEALSRDDTITVVAGQQPGFLTGPLYTIYKAVSAIALAEACEKAHGRRCVPVFWVAGEDHDVDEIREARFPGADGEVVARLPHAAGRRPLSTLPVDEATEAVLDEVIRHLRGRRHGDEAASLVELYRGRNLASGCAAILARLLGKHGLVIVDPEKLRPLAAPIFQRLVEEADAVVDALREGRRRLAKRGVKPFVAARLPLFLLRDGSREHVAFEGGRLRIDGGGPALDRAALLDELARDPGAFSAGAILRPLIQHVVLRSGLTVGGPAEVGYFAQLPPLSGWLGIETPRIALRAQCTMIDGKAARSWERLGIDGEDLAAARRPEDLVRLDDGSPRLEWARRLQAEMRALREELLEGGGFGEAARRRLERSSRKAELAVGGVVERLEQELRRRDEEGFLAATTLWNHVFPGDALQERRWNAFHYLAKYGTRWLEGLLDAIRKSPLSLNHLLLLFRGESS